MRPETTPPIPQLPFNAGPSLPPITPEKFSPTWMCGKDGWTLSVWAMERVGGLVIQVTPWRAEPRSKLEWHLAISHVASGFAVVTRRDGGTMPIDCTGKAMKAVVALRDALLAVGAWEPEKPVIDAAVVAPLVAEHLPALPMWRAWRRPRKHGEPLDCKWFETEKLARKWIDGERWWAIDHWTMPPDGLRWNEYVGLIDLGRVRFGELPNSCVAVSWMAHGLEYKASKGEQTAQRFSSLAGDADTARMLPGRAWAEARQFGIEPTGEVDPHALAAVDAGLLREVGEGLGRRWLPTLRGLLLMARHARATKLPSELETTRAALKSWRSARRSDLQRRDGNKPSGLEHERFVAFCHLLACIHRDSLAAASGAPRWELGSEDNASRYEGKLTVLSNDRGVACLFIDHCMGYVFLTLRTANVVSWAPGSALTAARIPDLTDRGPDGRLRYGDTISTLIEHRARDWAENYAAALRDVAVS